MIGKFEPHHRSSFTETMTNNWYINSNSKEVVDKNLQTLKATDRLVDGKTDPIKERVTRVEDKIKDLTKVRSIIENDKLKEISSSVLDTDRQKSLIETDKKESLHEKLIDNEKEIIKKEMKEMFERQNSEDVGKVIKDKEA